MTKKTSAMMIVGTMLALTAGTASAPELPTFPDSAYLKFVRQTVDTLLEKQKVPLGGEPGGIPFLAVSRAPGHAWVSVGYQVNGKYQLVPVPECELDSDPSIVDFRAWPLLNRLSLLTGERRYRDFCQRMASAFAQHGFHPRSGLLQVGAGMFDFDIRVAGPVSAKANQGSEAYFKPSDSMPWAELWAAAPEQMARFCRATFVGLVTRPADMRFNRYVHLDFDSRKPIHEMAFSPPHRGFLLTGAMLIKFWAMDYQHSGDPAMLERALRMARMWKACQNPKTGLLPHFIGADSETDTDQIPVPFANSGDAVTAVIFLETARALRDLPATTELAALLEDLGANLANGIAENSYDPATRIFEEWLKLEGGIYKERTYYTFRDQAAKAAALATDPDVAPVEVWAGDGFYLSSQRDWACGAQEPFSLAKAALLTGNPQLIERCRQFAGEILRQSRELKGEFNSRNQWTYPANGAYIKMFLDLFAATGETNWLAGARELADRSLANLAALGADYQPPWWRLPYRSGFLLTLLELHSAGLPATDEFAFPPGASTAPAAGQPSWSMNVRGPVRCLQLDSRRQFTPGSAQYEWADTVLGQPFWGWTVVAFPEPLLNISATNGFNERWFDLVIPLLEKHSVDLAVGGGGDGYLRARRFSSTGRGHAVQHLTCGAGAADAPTDQAAWVAVAAPGKHTVLCSATVNELHCRAVNGATVDHFTLSRTFPSMAERPWSGILAENRQRWPTLPTLSRQDLDALAARLELVEPDRIRQTIQNHTGLALKWIMSWNTNASSWQVEPVSLTHDLPAAATATAEFQLRPPAEPERFYPLPPASLRIEYAGRLIVETTTNITVPNRPTLTVPRLDLPAKLSGSPPAAMRERGARAALCWDAFGKPRTAGTQAWLAWDTHGLYIGFDCPDAAVKNARRLATKRDADNVWQDDCLEIFVDPDCSRSSARQFIATIGGIAYDTIISNKTGKMQWQAFDGEWQQAVQTRSDGWSAEFRIPWRDLGLSTPPTAGTRMGLHLTRLRRPVPATPSAEPAYEYYMWAATWGGNEKIANFGALILGE